MISSLFTLWVRNISGGGGKGIYLMGLSVNANSEPQVLYLTQVPVPDVITANAFQTSPPAVGNMVILNKFDATGNITYGSYIGASDGEITFPSLSVVGSNGGYNFDNLHTAPDGTTYLAFHIQRLAGQTGKMPTTPNAFKTDFDATGASQYAVMVMIFAPNNTLKYSSYFNSVGAPSSNSTMNAAGDLYVLMSGTGLGDMPPTSSGAFAATTTAANSTAPSYIMRFNTNGVITASSYVGGGFNSQITINPTTNDVVTMVRTLGTVSVYNAGLTTEKSSARPFGTLNLASVVKKIAVDKAGKLHAIFSNAIGMPITTGALRSSPDPGIMYYGIADCSLTKTVYGTYIPSMGGGLANVNDLAVDANCNAYLTGTVGTGEATTYQPFPVTPIAYNDNGTGTTTGYNLTPTSQDFVRNGETGYLMKFNYPKFKTNTNQITAPAITTFCVDGGVLPIEGTPTKYITPNLLGYADANPAPVPTHYKWQRASSATGPWTDLPESDLEDFSPAVPATAGTYFFRRLVRQTPFDIADACVNTCDPTEVSNVISLTFSANKTHKTDLSDKTYGFCKGGSLAVTANITPSTDGTQGPYTYKLTSLVDLSTVLMGQSGTKSAAPAAISLNITEAGQFLLQVTDSRNCTSFDTLTVEYFKLDAGSRIQFTCGASTLKIGPGAAPSEYINVPNNVIAWSPTTNLSNPAILSPIVTTVPAVGASVDYRISLNGCPIDTVTVTNEVVAPLPTLADIMRCQGDTATLGQGIASQTGVTYEWAPGFGLTSTTIPRPIVTTASAPAGVNETTYTLKAQNGTAACPQYTTQKVTVYRTPNQSFNLTGCMQNGCFADSVLKFQQFGTPAEPGISYTWTATVVDAPTNVGTTGLPTNAQALAFLSSASASEVTLRAGSKTLGRASKYGYKIVYVRKSFNTADPTCMRSDTATLYYCCGSGTACNLALGALPSVSCGGVNNKIGPIQYSSGGTYTWSRLDGQPLNNELFDVVTKLPLTNGGPHSNQVIANPSGLTAIDYRLTLIGLGGDTCRIDIKVFPSASAKPNVTYLSPQAVCQGNPYTIQGPAANPAYTYFWEPKDNLFTPADSAKALPKLKGLDANTSAYITVTDPSTGCFVRDTVDLVVSPVVVNAGDNATFCQAGATVDVGGAAGLSGYTYQWTAVPATGVTFANATDAKTTATLPATAVAGKIILYLTATNGQTSTNCSLKDSIILTSAAAPTVTLDAINRICTGGEISLAVSNPIGSSYDYLWTGPGIVGPATGSSIKANAAGAYSVVVSQGTCSKTTPVNVLATVPPTVTPNPASLCSGAATIGVNNSPDGGWTYSWDKFDAMKGNETDFSTISVEPTVATTYTLTATHVSGCVLTFPIAVPAAAYSADLPAIIAFCEGKPAVLPLNAPPSGSTVVWTATPASALAYLSSTTATQPSINMSNAEAGTFYFKASVTYGAGCTSTDSIKVNIGKKIENIAGFDQEICSETCTTLGITAVSGMVYEWSANPADASLTTLFAAKPKVCPTQNTTYTVKYFGPSGCIFTDDVLVKILPTPTLVVKDIKACQNATGTATVDLATSIVSTTGTIKTYWSNSAATNAVVNPVKISGTYYVKVEDAVCYAIKKVKLAISESPNGSLTTSFDCTTQKGLLRLSSVTSTARFDYSTGTTYTGTKTFADATVVPSGGIVATGLARPASAGQNYTVRLFGADSLCFKDITVKLTADNCPCTAPNAPISSGDKSACTGMPFPALTVTVGTGESANWYDAAGTLLLSNSLTYTPTAAGSYFAEAYRTALISCKSPKTEVKLVLNPTPTPSINSPKICVGQSATLMVQNCAGTVAWNDNSTSLVRTVSPTTTTTYSFICTANGCPSASVSATVTVNPLPILTITPAKIICDGSSVNLTVTANKPVATYRWSGSAIVPPINTATVNVRPAGSLQEEKTYIYDVIVTDTSGCADTATTTVIVTPSIRVDAGTDQTVCQTSTATLTATTNLLTGGNNGTVTVTWSEETGNPASNVLATPTGYSVSTNALAVEGVYKFRTTVTQTSPNGITTCVNSDVMQVTVKRKPIVTITPTDTKICKGGQQSITLAANLDVATPGGTSFVWTSTDDPTLAFLSCKTCANPSLVIPTSYTNATIRYQVEAIVATDNNALCSAISTVNIQVKQAPILTLTTPKVICDGSSVDLTVTSDKVAATYEWTGSAIQSPANTATVNVRPAGSLQENKENIYTVKITDTDGCYTSINTLVTVTPSIKVDAGTDQTICEATTASLTATTNLLSSSINGAISVTWSEEAGNPGSANLVTTAGYSVNTKALAPGVYKFRATVTQISPDGKTNCLNSDVMQVTVTKRPIITITPTQPNICPLSQETITLAATLSAGTPAGSSFYWSSSDDATLAFLDCKVCANPKLTIPAGYTKSTISYTVRAVNNPDNNLECDATDSVTINVNPVLEASIIDNVTVCETYIPTVVRRSTDLTTLAGTAVAISTWKIEPMVDISNVTVSGNTLSFDVIPSNNLVEYTVTLTSAESCYTTTKFYSYRNPRPKAEFSMDAYVCLGSNTQVLFNGSAKPGAIYTWSFAGANVVYSNDSKPYDGIAEGSGPHDISWANYPRTGNTYTVSLTVNDGGCTDTFRKDIRIERGYNVVWNTTNTSACNANDGKIDLVSALEKVTNVDVKSRLVLTWTGPNGYFKEGSCADACNLTGLIPGTYHVRVVDNVGCPYEFDFDILRPKNLGLNAIVGYKAKCGVTDGGIHIEIVGGTAPYTYTYFNAAGTQVQSHTSNNAFDYAWGLGQGKYTMKAVDKYNCMTEAETIIDNNDGSEVRIGTIVPTACGDAIGKVSFTIFGKAPFRYKLYSVSQYPDGTIFQAGTPVTLEFLGAGNYTMEVTDVNGCLTVKKFTISATAPNFNIAVTSTAGSCPSNPDGSENPKTGAFNITSPLGAYTYQWFGPDGKIFTPTSSTNPTGLATGIYKLVVSNGTCRDSLNLVINPAEGPQAVIVSTKNPTCPDTDNGSVTFVVNPNAAPKQTDVNNIPLTNVGPFYYSIKNIDSQDGFVKGGVIEESKNLTLNGLAKGTYVVSITDRNQCIGYQQFRISDPDAFNIVVSREDLSLCKAFDGKTCFTINGGTGNNYGVTVSSKTITPSVFTRNIERCMYGMEANKEYIITVTDSLGCSANFPVTLKQPDLCFDCRKFNIIDIVGYDMACGVKNEGKARVDVRGGTAPFSYKWTDATGKIVSEVTSNDSTNTLSGVAPGVYFVEVIDANNCKANANKSSVTLSQTGGPDVVLQSNTPAACGEATGSIRFSVTGNKNFSYVLTRVGNGAAVASGNLVNVPNATTIGNLTAGKYVLSVTDANGCVTVKLIDITSETFPFTVTPSIVGTSCDGQQLGSITLSLSNGGAGVVLTDFSFEWSSKNGIFVPPTPTSAVSLSSGSYSVKITYKGQCVTTRTFFVNPIDGPSVVATEKSPVSCLAGSDGAITLNINGNGQPIIGYIVGTIMSKGYNAPYPTSISNEAVVNLPAGDYEVKVIGLNGCISVTKVTVNKPKEIVVDVQTTFNCNANTGNALITGVSGGKAPYNLQLISPTIGTSSIGSLSLRDLIGGVTYTVKVTDANGCVVLAPFEIKNNCKGSLGDFVWKDTNNNGIQDETTTNAGGVANVIVELYKNGTLFTKDTTDATGHYLFTNLDAGTYKVRIPSNSIPAGCEISSSPNTGSDDAKDSDVDKTTGFSGDYVIDPTDPAKKDILTVDAGLIIPCIKPVLTAGAVTCLGTTYSVVFYSSTTNITTSVGTLSGSMVTGIPLGTNVTITATESATCVNTITVIAPTICPSTCILPNLTLGQPVCNGTTYSVSFTTDKGTVTTNAGTISGNSIINIPVGTDVTVTATDGPCISKASTKSPTDCSNVNPPPTISLSGPLCSVDGKTYTMNFITTPGVTVTASAGTVGINSITGIPAGIAVTITVKAAGYPNKVIVVQAPTNCVTPKGSLGDFVWKDANNNGIQDEITANAGGVASVMVELYKNGIYFTQQVTDATGHYLFTNLDAGTYKIHIHTTSLPAGCEISSKPNVGDDAKDSDVDKTTNFSGDYAIDPTDPTKKDILTVDVALITTCEKSPQTVFSTCVDNVQLPAPKVGQVWSVVSGNPSNATINQNGMVSGMIAFGVYHFTLSNGTCSETFEATYLDCRKKSDLSLKKRVNNKLPQMGDVISYTIVVRNEGEGSATGVEVSDTLPSGLQYQSFNVVRGTGVYNPSTSVWNLGTLAQGDSAVLTISVKVLSQGVIFNKAEISKMNEKDIDSTPGNNNENEDDLGRACISTPITICQGDQVEVSVPSTFKNVQWFKTVGATTVFVQTGNTISISSSGTYTYVASNGNCPAEGCCPVIVIVGDCCKPNVCIPYGIIKTRSKK